MFALRARPSVPLAVTLASPSSAPRIRPAATQRSAGRTSASPRLRTSAARTRTSAAACPGSSRLERAAASTSKRMGFAEIGWCRPVEDTRLLATRHVDVRAVEQSEPVTRPGAGHARDRAPAGSGATSNGASATLTQRSAALGRSPASACDEGRRRPCAGSYSAIVAQTDERVCATSAAPVASSPAARRSGGRPWDRSGDSRCGRSSRRARPNAARAAAQVRQRPMQATLLRAEMLPAMSTARMAK